MEASWEKIFWIERKFTTFQELLELIFNFVESLLQIN